MPKIVLIDDIEEGMVSSEPVVNHYGQTLIPSGATLQGRHIKLLRTWNIKTLSVKAEKTEQQRDINDELLKIAAERLSQRVKWKPRISIEEDLFNSIVNLIARNINLSDEY